MQEATTYIQWTLVYTSLMLPKMRNFVLNVPRNIICTKSTSSWIIFVIKVTSSQMRRAVLGSFRVNSKSRLAAKPRPAPQMCVTHWRGIISPLSSRNLAPKLQALHSSHRLFLEKRLSIPEWIAFKSVRMKKSRRARGESELVMNLQWMSDLKGGAVGSCLHCPPRHCKRDMTALPTWCTSCKLTFMVECPILPICNTEL